MKIEIRRAKASDKEPLMSFIKDVWGGTDYIPEVWDDWLRSKDGVMNVMTVDGVPMGMNRMRFMEDGSAWLEGVRIHPDYRGRGLASRLGRASMKEARSKGVERFRLATGSRNRAAQRQIAKMGFIETARLACFETKAGAEFKRLKSARRLRRADFGLAVSRITESSEYSKGGGVYWDEFTATSLTPEVIRKRIREGSVFEHHGALAIWRPGREGGERWSQVCFLTGEPSRAVELAGHVFASSLQKVDRNLVYVPKGSKVAGALLRAGLTKRWPLILYTKSPRGKQRMNG
ncbi:MAG TPA: GNAT family N-acetyltransferase [Nitrososphaerales archaeon]|nr:GNAT family N-acetyltransferase [Nitrososphaerales archaeon]